MTWAGFYLVCFLVGFVLALIGFLGGTVHVPHPHGLHIPGLHGHVDVGGHAAGHGSAANVSTNTGTSISPFNFATFMAFLAWFGGVGYLLTTRGNLTRLIVLGFALASGCAGAGIIFGFLTKVLLRHERVLNAADFEMVGVLGHVTVPIRSGGTGEIVYSQGGTRRSAGARSETGSPVGRGSEVVVTRYEKGIAYIRPWEEFAGAGAEAGKSASGETSHGPQGSG